MAIYPTPVDYMNIKQLRKVARIKGIAFDLSTTKADLVAAINA